MGCERHEIALASQCIPGHKNGSKFAAILRASGEASTMTMYAKTNSPTRRKRLHGWQRIGIVLSALWIIGIIAYLLYQRSAETDRLADAAYQLCDAWSAQALRENLSQGHPYNQPDCWAAWRNTEEGLRPMPQEEWRGYLLLAAIPMILAWIGAYLMASVVRWIRSGFSG
jgi:hypothetical protein